jgi:hypothetical protein
VKKIINILGILLAISGMMAVRGLASDKSSSSLGSEGPMAEVGQSRWDFGKVPNFGHVAHTFTIQNKGDALLRIDSIKTDCGCTTTNVTQGEVPQGRQWSFQVAFNAGVLPKGGQKTEWARVYTNDSRTDRKPLLFSVQNEVVTQGLETVEVTPTVIEINSKGQGDPVLQVKNKTAGTLKVSVVETSGFLVEARPRISTLGPQASAEIKLTLRLPKEANTRGPVVRMGGRPVHSSVTLLASGLAGQERFTIPCELAETARTRNVHVEPF